MKFCVRSADFLLRVEIWCGSSLFESYLLSSLQAMSQSKQAGSAVESDAGGGVGGRLRAVIDTVLGNLLLSIGNIHIRYEVINKACTAQMVSSSLSWPAHRHGRRLVIMPNVIVSTLYPLCSSLQSASNRRHSELTWWLALKLLPRILMIAALRIVSWNQSSWALHFRSMQRLRSCRAPPG